MPFNPSLPTDSRRQMVLPERERREIEDSGHNEAAHRAIPLKASLRQLLNKPVSEWRGSHKDYGAKKIERAFFASVFKGCCNLSPKKPRPKEKK